MKITGILCFSRELSYTQAQALKAFMSSKHEDKKYFNCPFDLTNDGKGIEWNKTDSANIEYAVLDIMGVLKKWNTTVMGVLHIVDNDQSSDLVVLKDMVKMMRGKEINTLRLAKNNPGA